MWPEPSSVKAVNLVKKSITTTVIRVRTDLGTDSGARFTKHPKMILG